MRMSLELRTIHSTNDLPTNEKSKPEEMQQANTYASLKLSSCTSIEGYNILFRTL